MTLVKYNILQDGQTPLMMASSGGHVGCVQMLLGSGAQVDHQDKVSAVLSFSCF